VTVEEPGLLGCAVWLCNLLPKLRRNYRLHPKSYDSIHGFVTLKKRQYVPSKRREVTQSHGATVQKT
jgi:hypothetical protein